MGVIAIKTEHNWLFICFEMMCDYFPSSYATRESKRKFLDLADHFCSLQNHIEHRLSVDSNVFFNRTIGLGFTRNEMHKEALQYYQKSYDMLSSETPEPLDFEDIVKTHFCMADCYSQLDDYENAIDYANKLINYLATEVGRENNYFFIALLYRAKIYRFYGKAYFSLSIADYISALELKSYILDMYHDEHFVDVVAAHVGLAMAYSKADNDTEALYNLHLACELIEKEQPDMDSEEYAYILYDMGLLFEQYGELERALQYLTEALQVEETMFYDDAHTVHMTLKKLSIICGQLGRNDLAKSYESRAAQYIQKLEGENGS